MEYNLPSELIKDLTFGQSATDKILTGVRKLAQAVKSTLGASGKCVIYEDGRGKPVITKDGVTVAQSVVLYDPVENIGATLIKEAANNTVKEAGDGTTTATVLAEALLDEAIHSEASIREIKNGIESGLSKIYTELEAAATEVTSEGLKAVAAISCNNDMRSGAVIADAYQKVGKDGVVLMEESETEETYVDLVDGVQMDCGLTSPHWVTNTEKHVCELDNPYVLIVSSEIPNIRKIQAVLEHVIKKGRSLLIVAPVAQQVKSALLMNKAKGNIKVNIIDLPGFGPTKQDTIKDLAILTGATVINEELGDDLDLISVGYLGEAEYVVTSDSDTVLTRSDMAEEEEITERIEEVRKKITEEKNDYIKGKLESRLAMLSGSVGIIKVGANSKVELKEKKDRIEDAIYATKAALKEGIVPGGGVALRDISKKIRPANEGERVLLSAIEAPYLTVLDNAGLTAPESLVTGEGVDVVSGANVDMMEAGVVDPVLVTKSALKNAASVVSTIISADCIISNARADESRK